jgi:hypothetical protein
VSAETAPARPSSGGLCRVARAVLWPIRRFFDPRFGGIFGAVQDVKRLLITDMEAANETATLTGRTLDRLVAQNEVILARLDASDGIVDSEYESFATAYAFRALAGVPPGASVAVVGGNDSVGRSLAALGYDVTSEHGLRTAHHEGELDAVLCLSLSADAELRRRLRHLTRDGGVLVLGAAVGPAPVDGAQRVYDQAGLDELLEDWEPADVTLVQRREPGSWARVDGGIADLDPTHETVAMVTATKRSD